LGFSYYTVATLIATVLNEAILHLTKPTAQPPCHTHGRNSATAPPVVAPVPRLKKGNTNYPGCDTDVIKPQLTARGIQYV